MLFDYLPLLVFLVMVVLFGGGMTLGIALLGPRHPTRAKGLPYECGIVPAETARRRFSVSFYLTAMLFIVFDVEAVFLYPWAVLVKHTLHMFGFIEIGRASWLSWALPCFTSGARGRSSGTEIGRGRPDPGPNASWLPEGALPKPQQFPGSPWNRI